MDSARNKEWILDEIKGHLLQVNNEIPACDVCGFYKSSRTILVESKRQDISCRLNTCPDCFYEITSVTDSNAFEIFNVLTVEVLDGSK